MKNSSASLFILLFFSIKLLYSQNTKELDTSTLKQHVKKINTIKSTSDNSDLYFLDKELENIEILMLGEQSQGDANAFLAKTRIIKYLHKNKKFNVLVFESGLADVYRVWKKIKKGNNNLSVFDNALFKTWAKSEQMEELFEYILQQSKTDNPLYIAGFAPQPSGNMTLFERWDELHAYLKKTINFNEKDYPLVPKVLKDNRVIYSKEFTEESLESLINDFKKIGHRVAKKEASKYGKLMVRYIDGLSKTLLFYKKANFRNPSSTPHAFNLRDRGMAKNLIFLKETIFPDNKLIVWSSNNFLGYNRALLNSFQKGKVKDKELMSFGSHIKAEYLDKVYAMMFTSYSGYYFFGTFNANKKAHKLTLEGKLSNLGFMNAFLSLKNKKFKKLQFATRIYDYTEMNGAWGQMCDGVFFIKDMTPNKLKE